MENRMDTKPRCLLLSIFTVFLAVTPAAIGLCYTLKTPHTGYIPGLESGTSGCACGSYLHCPAGVECQVMLAGWKPCTAGTATVAQHVYTGGVCIASGKCTAGVFSAPSATATCVVPADSLGSSSCWIFQPPVIR